MYLNRSKGIKYNRQYFYYVNKDGQLFLHDARVKNFISCLKEKKFLNFFFKRLRVNDTGHFEDFFKFISPCGKELVSRGGAYCLGVSTGGFLLLTFIY